MPGVVGWLGAAGCGFPTISTCVDTKHFEQYSSGLKNCNNAKGTEVYLRDWCGGSCADEGSLSVSERLLHDC